MDFGSLLFYRNFRLCLAVQLLYSKSPAGFSFSGSTTLILEGPSPRSARFSFSGSTTLGPFSSSASFLELERPFPTGLDILWLHNFDIGTAVTLIQLLLAAGWTFVPG